jgi:hypothetical protein
MNRRILIGALAIAAWVIAGVALRLDAFAYLLLGVPLMLAFQWKIARRPLWNAWVAGDARPRVDGRTWAIALLVAAAPAWALVSGLLGAGPPSPDAPAWPWAATAVAGAFIAAPAIRAQRGAALRRALPATLGALVAMGLLFTIQALQRHHRLAPAWLDAASLRAALESAIVYFDVAFVVEEVAFRGVLDPYILGDERGANAALASAVVSSALWGVWHLPIVYAPGTVQPLTMARVILGHAGIGLLLCLAVRAAGTLVPGAAGHALGDAFRDFVS